MRILVLTKRQYTAHDLIDDAYGRVRELPLALAKRGHEIRGICLSYASRPEDDIVDADSTESAHVSWHSMNAGRLKLPGLWRFWKRAQTVAREFRPDVIWTFSDTIYTILGERLAHDFGICSVADLYDNFEAFGSVRIPGVRALYRRAVRRARGVVCVSEPLCALVTDGYGRTGPTWHVPNGVRSDIFRRLDKTACRQTLGLPVNGRIIGTAGALHSNRDIDTLFRAFEIAATTDDVHLAVAGHRDARTIVPSGPRIHDLGILPHDRVPLLLNSLDVAVIANRDSRFGRYCFPQKAVEMLSCETPFVAANVGAMSALLKEYPQCLFIPGSPASLAAALVRQLHHPFCPPLSAPSWDELAAKLEKLLRTTVAGA